MRIIAGNLKGRKLFTPVDQRIRPTSDKVKEALFSMIAPYLEDSVVIDLFSGTGSLGLEALSRGARRVYYGDKSRSSLDLTRKNIAVCNVKEQCITLLGDWLYILERIHEPADLVFLDPPYKSGLMIECIHKIQDLSLLKKDGLIIAEHGIDESLPEVIGSLSLIKEKRYGSIVISLYAYSTEDNE